MDGSSFSPKIPFVEYDLDNGMHVILSHSETVPLVVTNLWYHVGSKDEHPSRTGFAHLFEHMMFQGSKNIGKTEHFKYIQRCGGSLNATTSVDRTNYFETVPSGELELALWLESDRMLALNVTQATFENQRAVVKEERRQRYENRPYGTVWETIVPHLYPTSGYHWTTIGSMEHLDAATIDDVRGFHHEYYKPNNCSLAIIGNFDERTVRPLIDKYFGGIPRGADVNRPKQNLAPIAANVRFEMQDAIKLSAVYIATQAPCMFERDEFALDLLGHILDTGRSSRLYQELVYRREIARDVEAYNHSNEKAGAFVLSAKVQMGSTPLEVEEALLGEVKKLQDAPVSEQDLTKVKNRVEMATVARMTELGHRADQLQRGYTYARDTDLCNRDLDTYRSITAEEIQHVAKKYLGEGNSVVAHVLPR